MTDTVMLVCVAVISAFILIACWGATLMMFKEAFFPSWWERGIKNRAVSLFFGIALLAVSVLISMITYDGVTNA